MGVSQDEMEQSVSQESQGEEPDAEDISGALVSVAGILALILLLAVVASLAAAFGWWQHPVAR